MSDTSTQPAVWWVALWDEPTATMTLREPYGDVIDSIAVAGDRVSDTMLRVPAGKAIAIRMMPA